MSLLRGVQLPGQMLQGGRGGMGVGYGYGRYMRGEGQAWSWEANMEADVVRYSEGNFFKPPLFLRLSLHFPVGVMYVRTISIFFLFNMYHLSPPHFHFHFYLQLFLRFVLFYYLSHTTPQYQSNNQTINHSTPIPATLPFCFCICD